MGVDADGPFGAVCIVAAVAVLAHQWLWFEVIRARKRYGVAPPKMYLPEDGGDKARAFNCVQRAHQNCLESLPQFFALLILGGLRFPWVSAVLGASYIVARLLYFYGYTSGDPNNRFRGIVWVAILIAMSFVTLWAGYVSLVDRDDDH